MKYIAKPVTVDAHKIVSVSPLDGPNADVGKFHLQIGSRDLVLEDGRKVTATGEMLARMTPVPGDYWVIQSDGYPYLNPREVFEKKYSPVLKAAA